MTDEIISLLADITRRPPAAFLPDTPLDIDSLDRVELAMALGDRFGVEVPDNEVWEWRTPADAARWVAQRAVR